MTLTDFRKTFFSRYVDYSYERRQKAYLLFWCQCWAFIFLLFFSIFDFNRPIVTDSPGSEIILAGEIVLCIIILMSVFITWNRKYDYSLKIITPSVVIVFLSHYLASLQWFVKTGISTHREFFYIIIGYLALFHSRKALILSVGVILSITSFILFMFNQYLNEIITPYVIQASLNGNASILTATILLFCSSLINERALRTAKIELEKNKDLNKNLNIKVKERTQQLFEEKEKLNSTLDCLKSELEEASKYVSSMLPHPINRGPIKSDWRFFSSESLGGDSFGYHWLDRENFAIYLLDVSGHGVGAALLSVSILNALRTQSLLNTDFKSPQEVLEALNRGFPSESNNYMFFTIWYGVYNCVDRTLTYSSGGHPPAILIGDNSSNGIEIETLRTNNCAIGSFSESSFKMKSIKIPYPHSLYVFSDGVYEFTKTDGTMWNFTEFLSFLKLLNPKDRPELDAIYDKAKYLKGSEKLDDDFTILKIDFQ